MVRIETRYWYGSTLYGLLAHLTCSLCTLEVVSTGSPHKVTPWVVAHQCRTYGGFIDAVCDKAFVIPCWIFLLSMVSGSTYLRTLQYAALWCLILAETASGSIRFRAFFTAGGVAAPTVEGFDFSTSAVKVSASTRYRQYLQYASQ